MNDCLFCNIAGKKIPAKIVFEDTKAVAFEDINPQAPHHVLIIPRAHFATVSDVPESDSALLGHLVSVATKIAEEREISRSGFRLVMNCQAAAGQSVFHVHLHLMGGRSFAWPPG